MRKMRWSVVFVVTLLGALVALAIFFLTASPDLVVKQEDLASVLASVVAGAVTIASVAAMLSRYVSEGAKQTRRRRTQVTALGLAGHLLPRDVRAGYVEEWQRWMADLVEQGMSRRARVIEWLSIIFRALPSAVFRLRVAGRKIAE